MELFHNLTPFQVEAITKLSAHRPLRTGEWVYREGDKADALYVVTQGAVEIIRTSPETGEPKVVAHAETGQTFGEVGFFAGNKTRTASVRAEKETTLLKIPRNPAQVFRSLDDYDAATRIMQNLICILGERLNQINEEEAKREREGFQPRIPVLTAPPRPLEIIENWLPRGVLSRYFSTKTVKPQEYLCWEGDKSDGFFFVHRGELEVLKLDPQKALRRVAFMRAPTVAGELGFFTGEAHAACLRAVDEVTYTKFSGHDFEKLKKHDPPEAIRILTAAAQLVAHLIEARP